MVPWVEIQICTIRKIKDASGKAGLVVASPCGRLGVPFNHQTWLENDGKCVGVVVVVVVFPLPGSLTETSNTFQP